MEKKDLEKLKADELKIMAKEKGIANADSMKKADLVEAILKATGESNEPVKPVETESKGEKPLHKIPGKYLKLAGFIKGEN